MEETDVRILSDDALRQRLKDLARAERVTTAALLLHLAEYDRRGLYVADGFSRLWDYCERALGLSENEIKLRIQAARALRDNPRLQQLVTSGEIKVAALGRLAPHLDAQRGPALIEQARNKTRREVERIVAGVSIEKELQARIAKGAQEAERSPEMFPAADTGSPTATTPADCSAYVRERERDSIVPVTATDFRVSFLASEEFIKGLRQSQALLARRHPQARLEDVLGAICELFLAKADPLRRAQARRKLAGRARAEGVKRAGRVPIPSRVRDSVLERYGNRCAFEGSEGRCPEVRWLELDHIVPFALGGTDAKENLRPMCRRHNAFMAILAFGEAYIEGAIRRRREAAGSSNAS